VDAFLGLLRVRRKVHVPAIGDLESVLDRFLMHGETTSSFVVATPVAPRTVLPPPLR
jgi:Lrp/AsnC family transcriptional regulator, leucine-responsive regulatory protein